MTNVRVTYEGAEEWVYCPYCGGKVTLDQEPDLLRRSADGDIDVERSRENGFVFEHSLSHCGFHIRLWIPEDDESGLE